MYFDELSLEQLEDIFYKTPQYDSKSLRCMEDSPLPQEIASGLEGYTVGSLLYTPSIKKNIAEDLIGKKILSLHSNVFDFEDALNPSDQQAAIESMSATFRKLDQAGSGITLPDFYIRIRNPQMLIDLNEFLAAHGDKLKGIILPKAEAATVVETFHYAELLIKHYEVSAAKHWKLMPIIESAKFMRLDSRVAHLLELHRVLAKYKEYILQVRVGATDFCGLFGVRRAPTSTIYDISAVRDALASILTVFSMDNEFTISGPVWEYFANTTRLFKPTLRTSLVSEKDYGTEFYNYMVQTGMYSFIQEIQLDIENGFVGKTIIHPTHVVPVQAMLTVSREEYEDALALRDLSGGVANSSYKNKMNESRPHQNWAVKILSRAAVYGVLNNHRSPIDIIYAYWAMDRERNA